MNYYNYFTEIEEHFVRRRGKHLFVSPMDWSLIATWRDSGVPLHVALRGIDRAMDTFFAGQPHRESRIGSLFYCHSAVMEEYAHHLESHLGEDPAASEAARPQEAESSAPKADGPDKKSILAFLADRIAEINALSGKLPVLEGAPDGMSRLVLRLEEIMRDLETDNQLEYESLDRDLAILDEALIRELRAALTAEQMAAWEQEAKQDLKVYRKKLPKETYNKILENFLRSKIHRHFHVGELSLFHM
jgi:hypothetical protein